MGVRDEWTALTDDADAFRTALHTTGLAADWTRYATLLTVVSAQVNERCERGTATPLNVRYEGELSTLLRCLYCGLPRWTRCQAPDADINFTTSDVSGCARFLIASTGEHNLKGLYFNRVKRGGYLTYAAETLHPEEFAEFFGGLDRIAKELGDEDASSEAIRKLVCQCWWDRKGRRFTDAPNLDKLSERDLSRLLSGVTQSGAYSELLWHWTREAKRKAGTLTDALASDLSAWEAECLRRYPELIPCPVIDWDAVNRDWNVLSVNDQQKMSVELQEALNKPNMQEADSVFRNLVDYALPQKRNIYYLLLLDNRVSGKVRAPDLIKRYCHELMESKRGASIENQWKQLSLVCSLGECLKDSSFNKIVANRAFDLLKSPGGLKASFLHNYNLILERLYPYDPDAEEKGMQKAREYYWNQPIHFTFNALAEYEAFDDGTPRFFLELARMPDKFRPENPLQFLEPTYRLFQLGSFTVKEVQDYVARLYTEINQRNGNELPADYQSWMYMAGLAKNLDMLSAVEELYKAFPAFEPENILRCYMALVIERKAVTEIRTTAYELVKKACFRNDSARTIPLDLWIFLGKEGTGSPLFKLQNYFAVFEQKPDARILSEDPAQTARNSDLFQRQDVQNAASAYAHEQINNRNIQRVVKEWLKEAAPPQPVQPPVSSKPEPQPVTETEPEAEMEPQPKPQPVQPTFQRRLRALADAWPPSDGWEFLSNVRNCFLSPDVPPGSENAYLAGLMDALSRKVGEKPEPEAEELIYMAAQARNDGVFHALEAFYHSVEAGDAAGLSRACGPLWDACGKADAWRVRFHAERTLEAFVRVRDTVKNPIPLDIWLYIGQSKRKRYRNCFDVFSEYPDAYILDADPAKTARESVLMKRGDICAQASDYVRTWRARQSATPEARRVGAYLREVLKELDI